MLMNRYVAVCVLVFASACGSSGGGFSGLGSGDFPQPSDSIAAMNAFDSLAGTQGYTNPVNFPGSATYDGVVTLQRFGAQYYGELDMTANFGTGAFSGNMSNFNVFDTTSPTTFATNASGGFSMAGTLTGNNGAFTNALNGVATGSLDGLSDALTVTGQFAGTNAEGVQLLLQGGVFQGVANGD